MQTDHFKALSNQIEITVTPEGLRIELLESKNGTFLRYREHRTERKRARDC